MSNVKRWTIGLSALALAALTGCGDKSKPAEGAGAPPAAKVEREADSTLVKVDHPEQFALAQAEVYKTAPELSVTGSVTADVSRSVPVISLVSGRVTELAVRLGDTVHKGQLLFKVHSTDVSGAYSDYRKAVANEELARTQLNRAKVLYDNGAIAKSALEVAQNAEATAKVDLDTTTEHLKLLESDPAHPTGVVPVYAPVAGVITDQEITAGAGVQALNTPAPLTISDLSHVWVLCDVFENNLASIAVGQAASIVPNAYPAKTLNGRISNISPILDPNLRTAKVRVEVPNPGLLLKVGMFAAATLHGTKTETHASVPANAVLHLHDRDWVYIPAGAGHFRRLGVTGGKMLSGNLQEIVAGLDPGAQVVANALVLQNTVDQ
jgi:cobalt-zinc-cadmium efflux system membrane fusion protein